MFVSLAVFAAPKWPKGEKRPTKTGDVVLSRHGRVNAAFIKITTFTSQNGLKNVVDRAPAAAVIPDVCIVFTETAVKKLKLILVQMFSCRLMIKCCVCFT